ncbi:hypothetical protein [Vibrio phage Va2]|nr:hypothetical protein [Vibrio phage Va2]
METSNKELKQEALSTEDQNYLDQLEGFDDKALAREVEELQESVVMSLCETRNIERNISQLEDDIKLMEKVTLPQSRRAVREMEHRLSLALSKLQERTDG